MKRLILAILLGISCTSHAQYRVFRLFNGAVDITDSLPKAVIQLTVPNDVIRVIYRIRKAESITIDTTSLYTKVIAGLPDHLDWLGVAGIANKLDVEKHGPALFHIYHFSSMRCVKLFSSARRRSCKPLRVQENCTSGVYDIDWQATLFKENYYLFLRKVKVEQVHAIVEVIAVVAD